MPFPALEVDDALSRSVGTVAVALLVTFLASYLGGPRERGRRPSAEHRNEQRAPQDIRYEARQDQQYRAEHGCRPGGIQMQRGDAVVAQGVGEASEITASRPFQQDHAHD